MEKNSHEHGLDTSHFFNDLIDGRYVVLEALENTGRQQYSSFGCEAKIYEVHHELADYLDTDIQDIPASISLNFYVTEDKEFSIDSLCIEPCDGAPINYSIEDGLVALKVGNNDTTYYEDKDMIRNALLMLIPSSDYADPAIIADSIFNHSPHSTRTICANIGNASIASIERETLNDSTHALEIKTSYPHECGLLIEQITTIEEYLRKAIKNIETERSVDIRVGIPVLCHQSRMIDGKLINVSKPSRLHTENARHSLEKLYEIAFS